MPGGEASVEAWVAGGGDKAEANGHSEKPERAPLGEKALETSHEVLATVKPVLDTPYQVG